jgi:hypothetical protein
MSCNDSATTKQSCGCCCKCCCTCDKPKPPVDVPHKQPDPDPPKQDSPKPLVEEPKPEEPKPEEPKPEEPKPEEPKPEEPKPAEESPKPQPTPCSTKSGDGVGDDAKDFDFTGWTGTIYLNYESFTIPNAFEILIDGVAVAASSGAISTAAAVQVYKDAGITNVAVGSTSPYVIPKGTINYPYKGTGVITIRVKGGKTSQAKAWSYKLTCNEAPPVDTPKSDPPPTSATFTPMLEETKPAVVFTPTLTTRPTLTYLEGDAPEVAFYSVKKPDTTTLVGSVRTYTNTLIPGAQRALSSSYTNNKPIPIAGMTHWTAGATDNPAYDISTNGTPVTSILINGKPYTGKQTMIKNKIKIEYSDMIKQLYGGANVITPVTAMGVGQSGYLYVHGEQLSHPNTP